MPGTTGKKKSHYILAEVIGLDHQEAVELPLHNGSHHVIHMTLDLLVLPSPNLMVEGQVQQSQPEKGMVTSLRSLKDENLYRATSQTTMTNRRAS